MAQQTIVRDKEIAYSGLFHLKDLYAIMDKWFQEHGYEKNELDNEEHVTEHGKEVILHIMPVRFYSDYVKLKIDVEANFHGIQDVEIEKDGVKRTLQKGSANFMVSSYIESDYEQKWEAKPLNFFLRTLFDKFVFKKYTTDYEQKIRKDTADFITEVKAFLNLNRY